MTEDNFKIINNNYIKDKAEIEKNDFNFGNMNYYLNKDEYIKKHLWKTAEQVEYDIIEAMKKVVRGY